MPPDCMHKRLVDEIFDMEDDIIEYYAVIDLAEDVCHVIQATLEVVLRVHFLFLSGSVFVEAAVTAIG